VVKNKRDYHLIVEKPPTIGGRKREELWFASIIQQKHNVGFYLMAVDCSREVRAQISPALLQHLDGKVCFHFTALTKQLKKDVNTALKVSQAFYRKQKWL
jgi:hypothetical protein